MAHGTQRPWPMRGTGVLPGAARVKVSREWLCALATTREVNSKVKDSTLEQLINQKVLGEVLRSGSTQRAIADAERTRG